MILIFQYHDDYFCVKLGVEFFASDWVFKLSQSDPFRPISIPENFFSQNFSYLKKSRRFLPPFRAGASEVHFLEPQKFSNFYHFILSFQFTGHMKKCNLSKMFVNRL